MTVPFHWRILIKEMRNQVSEGGDTMKWGGHRLGAGRPETGKKTISFWVTPGEEEKLRAFLKHIRQDKEQPKTEDDTKT